MENLNDTAVLISALPREASMRDSNVQKQLVEILLNHYQSEHEKSTGGLATMTMAATLGTTGWIAKALGGFLVR